MKSSLNSAKKNRIRVSKKIATFLFAFVIVSSILITPLHPAKAQWVTMDPGAITQLILLNTKTTTQAVVTKVKDSLKTALLKAGSVAFQRTLSTALNKIAYDTATYLGSGDKGQKPLFVTNWQQYLVNVGDDAAGQFVQDFAANLSKAKTTDCQNTYSACSKACPPTRLATDNDTSAQITKGRHDACIQICKDAASSCGTTVGTDGAFLNQPSFNICEPSSLQAKVTIGLGLVEQTKPSAPNCSASKMVQNWRDQAVSIYDDAKNNPNFLQQSLNGIFDPTSNDLGIYLSAHNDLLNTVTNTNNTKKDILLANKGWIDPSNIGGSLIGIPGQAQRKLDEANAVQTNNIGKLTGDIVVDAANVFLNQYALTKFNDLMSSLGKKVQSNTSDNTPSLSDKNADISYGQGSVEEAASTLIKPDFGSRADYDILSSLGSCPDSKNPGPTDCVLDDKFLQGISEKKTVAEAIQQGYIHGDWQLTKDVQDGAYSLRNIEILRKYRILPVGWEEAINRATASSTKITVMDMVSCFDPNDTYNQYSSTFDTRDQTWCRGLIDPNWVLKAPLNSCLKSDFGAQILNKSVTPSTPAQNGNPYSPSSLNITRADNYCADEQTCIKEKDDGSCDAYGYCNEEQRTWNFSTDSCNPIYNTCQSFTNPISGASVSYLENTLNYGTCNADSAGCRQYSIFGAFASSTGTVSWQANKSIYFNKNVAACSSSDEACTELLRVKPTWGANLVMDSDFADEAVYASSTAGSQLGNWTYWSSTNTDSNSRVATIVDTSDDPGIDSGKALKIEATRTAGNTDQIVIGTYSNASSSLLPDDFQLISGQSYTVSADVFLAEGDATHIYLGDVNDGYVSSSGTVNGWQHLSVTRTASNSFSEPVFGINADSTGGSVKVYIKNLKFEVSNFETGYTGYADKKVYEKLIPAYLEKTCYNDVSSATKDYSLKSDAPTICSNYARKCNNSEVGCESFTNEKSGLSVAAQVNIADYCPKECNGYDVYISKEDHFNSPQSENIIPTSAQSCTAEAVGCNEFTNLDSLAQGGETKEYYSFIKQCIKPSPTQCGNFYSWEGTDTGYQLRSYSLEKSAVGDPAVTSDDSALCNAVIYNKTLGDPLYNADCREFYDSSGGVSYHLISDTVTCSDNCHAYRMSDKNIDKTLTQTDCEANPTTRHWDAATGNCYSCLNGGTWDDKLSACVYQAIPGEGQTCSAAENGCREYNGNDGNNVRMLSYSDFETGAQNWNSNCASGLQLTTISNNKDGHSLLYKSSATNCLSIGSEAQGSVAKQPLIKQVFASDNVAAQLKVGTTVTQGKSYTLRFIAKAATDTVPKVYFYNNDPSNPQMVNFTTSGVVIKGGGEWNIYQVNLDNLNHAVTDNEVLVISADNDFYFDDIVLTEITDRYYLVKNSSVIPDSCYYDISGNYQGADYNLGCSQYSDRDKLVHNLHKFSKLCSDSSVGCEQMINTQNYEPSKSGIWGDTNNNGICDSNEPDCVKVDADKAIAAVYDASKQCNSADMGCSRMGQGSAGATAWSDVYKDNNPNLYDTTLCGQNELGCEEWKASDGTYNYFKDPGNEACGYRDSHDPAIGGKAWYKIPVMRCDLNKDGKITDTEKTGKICSVDTDCASGTCIADNNDYPCSTSYFKTFGLGGAGNQVAVPDQQAGVCDATAAGCTEYIDPVSQFSPNLVYNPNYETDSSSNIDGWDNGTQTVTIEPNKLYIFSVRNNSGKAATTLSFPSYVKELLTDNTLGNGILSLTIPAGTNQSLIFSSLNNTSLKISGGEANKAVEIKASVINYQLQANVDKSSCNGVTNFDNGCVLFNERSMNGASGLIDLSSKYDAQASQNQQAPVNCNSSVDGSCAANQLIKVSPNRVCGKWLDCMTYTQDPTTKERTCYAVGECTRLNDKNECANFEDVSTSSSKFIFDQNKNATGYYLLDKYHLANMQEVGLDTEAHFDFEDNVPALSCRRVGGGECAFNTNIVSDLLIREPEKAAKEADYPAHGASYLKVPASYEVSPQSRNSWITVLPNTNYYLNYLVNTKGTGLSAMIYIYKNQGGLETFLTSTTVTSNDGWSRLVFPFNTGDASNIRIYLGADPTTSDRAVYFDDLNIEPVLEVNGNSQGDKQYVSRECRLYPTDDSLTCVNKNNNVLKDGWEGYCLQHDPSNPDVCLMWYPVDQISSTKLTQTTSGYQGKYPLNYCTEVNGNFDLVKKLVGEKIKDENYACSPAGGCGDYCKIIYSGESGFACPGSNYKMFVAQSTGGSGIGYEKLMCVPDESKLLLTTKTVTLNEEDNVMGNCDGQTYSEGWVKYDGQFQKLAPTGSGCSSPVNKCDKIDESTNADPNIRVYDYSHQPADEDALKLISGTDTDKIFRLTCNNFIETVDSNGDNQAWAARVGINSIWATGTPPFFYGGDSGSYYYYGVTNGSPYNIAAYGRNRQDTPFGAALWPDSFSLINSGPVQLKNQFSVKNSESILAGRPFGCSNYKDTDQGSGCADIGFCSQDPNVYCLLSHASGTDIVAQKTCGEAGYGTCVPLWSTYLGYKNPRYPSTTPDYQAILSNLFLKSYNAYSLSDGTYSAVDNLKLSEDMSNICQTRPDVTYGNAAIAANAFCAVYPIIDESTIALRYNNQIINNGLNFSIPRKGIYSLEFTSNIDPEQQPLREIYINWGDKTEQVITGQDSRPSKYNPHIFYHYYKMTGQILPVIRITDNWGKVTEETLHASPAKWIVNNY